MINVQLLEAVLRTRDGQIEAGDRGPWNVYFSPDVRDRMIAGYEDGDDKSLRQRLQEVEGIASVEMSEVVRSRYLLFLPVTTPVGCTIIDPENTTWRDRKPLL